MTGRFLIALRRSYPWLTLCFSNSHFFLSAINLAIAGCASGIALGWDGKEMPLPRFTLSLSLSLSLQTLQTLTCSSYTHMPPFPLLESCEEFQGD